MRVFRSDGGWAAQERVLTPPFIVSMSPPDYPSAWLRPRSARFRFARQDHCSSATTSRFSTSGCPVIPPEPRPGQTRTVSVISDLRNRYSPRPPLTQNSDVMPLWFDLAFVALFGIGLLVAIRWPRLWRSVQFSDSSNWPMMPATVEEVNVEAHYRRSSTTYTAEVVYSYQVGGEYYSGRYTAESFSEEDANAIASKHPRASKVQIHVNPAKPEVSDLIP
jgi:Protein of unknown function (DUF3592)